MEIFFEIATALVIAAVFGIAAYLLRQPTIVGFMFAGIIIGYFGGLKDANHLDIVEALSSIGVALLLFIVGLEMNFREMRDIGFPVIMVGIGQIVVAFALGFWLSESLGFSQLVSAYLGLVLAFSSTAIIVRLLSDKKDLKSLYGRISLGYLLFQDLIAIFVAIFLSGLGTDISITSSIVIAVLKGIVFVLLAIGLSRILPKLLDRIGGSQDLLYLFSIAWAVGMGALFSSKIVGLSIEPGGFLAGIALANSSEHFQISAKLKPLRDFFLIILFMGLGARIIASGESVEISHVLAFSFFNLVINPIIVFMIMSFLRYRARTAFLTSLASTQISEFGFIIVVFGEHLGHLSSGIVSLVALIGIVSISISSYLIVYSNKVYKFIRPVLKMFEFKNNLIEEKNEETYLENHIVLVGVHRMGQNILRSLSASEEDFVAVDFDPRIIESLRQVGLPALYGDITDPEIQELVSLNKCKLLISTIPDFTDNITLLQSMKKNNPAAKIILNADTEHEAEDMYELGADYVLLPHFMGGVEISELIAKDKDLVGLEALKERDFDLIKKSI